jgi:L-xylulokinase
MARYYLGLDNGGSKSKASLYDLDGREVAVAGVSAVPVVRRGGFVERDSDQLWALNAQVIRAVIAKSGIDPRDIAGVAVSGHGNGVYMIGEDGRPSAPGIVSTDTRAAAVVRRWLADGVQTRIIPKTNQILWAGQPVAILAWYQEHQPEVLERTRWALPCKDYIRYRLTGEVYGEITDMSTINVMDLQTREYDDRILSEFGLEKVRHIFPPLKLSTDVCGRVTREAAQQTGLIEGTMVSGGLFDCASCCLAAGVIGEGTMSVIAGTWSINSFVSQVPVWSEELFMTSLFCRDGYYITTEGSMTSAGNLEWFIGSFLTDDDGNRRDNVYDYCNSLAGSLQPQDSSVIFLPFLYGTNVNPDAKACFLGIDGSQGKAHMVRAMYEGVVFSAKMHIEKLLRFTDAPQRVRISGGATESPLWVQMFADVLQMPIEVSDARELGTLGAAMTVAVAAGDVPDLKTAAERMTRVRYRCEPNPAVADIYEKKYEIYKNLLSALDPVWAEWRALQ